MMSLRDDGNTEFRQGNWLKAAALYTKAIKADPESAVLYSNRSAALLKLKKVSKALEDAEECIRRRPEWDKGHYRKGLVLELMQRYGEAVAAMKAALERSPGNEEMTRKISQLQKLTGVSMSAAARKDKENLGGNKAPAGAAADSHSKGKEPVSAAATSPQEPEQGRQQATPAAPAIPEDDLPSPLAEFQRDCMAHALDRGDAEPCVYVLHGSAATDPLEDSMSVVTVSKAFDSPDLLHNCLSFLRDYAAEKAALAACAVVPLKGVAYPQVWKRRGWPLASAGQGVLVQLEAPKLCRMWLVPPDAGEDVGKAIPLCSDHKLLEPLFY